MNLKTMIFVNQFFKLSSNFIKMEQHSKTKISQRRAAADGKIYYSYTDIHQTILSVVNGVKEFKPDIILAIGGGGFIPARIIRTSLKIPMLAVNLSLYNDDNTARVVVD